MCHPIARRVGCTRARAGWARPFGSSSGGRPVVALAAALALLLVPAGALRAEVPPPGTDLLNAAGSIELEVPGVGTDYVRLFGQMSILRQPPDPGSPNVIPTEIVSLNLTGFSPMFGRVLVVNLPPSPCVGKVVMPLPTETPADSFFDIFYEVDLPDLGRSFASAGPFHVEAMTTAIPFFDVFSETYSQMVPMTDLGTGLPGASLNHVSLDPHPEVDILFTDAQLKWTLGRTSEMVSMGGRSVVVRSESFMNPATGKLEFNTELVEMTLTGASPSFGPLQFMEQTALHSPGSTVAIDPGPAQFPADSFFDVFFGVRSSSFDVFCADPLTGRATVNGWPPLGTMFIPPGPCVLFDRATGAQVGTLDSFVWTWTQPAGTCVDNDGDGVFAPPCGTDCDDNDPNNYPGNLENCADGRDNNCNQRIDCLDPVCVGRPCDDGDRCTRPDVCTAAGVCAGQPVNCDDNNKCTFDRCNPDTGECDHVPVNCDDQNPCTADTCDPATGQCRSDPMVGAPCDDANLCTQGDQCIQTPTGGVICAGTPVDCDDGDPCTGDACNPDTGQCVHNPVVGPACDDGNVCTQDDRCVQSPFGGVICQGTPVDCDDQNPCTLDRCDPEACIVPDNGTGTATLPPRSCGYVSESNFQITDGLPAGTTIEIPAVHKDFVCPLGSTVCSFPLPSPGVDCDQPGGTLGGEQECANSILAMSMTGTGALAGFSRMIDLPVGMEAHAAPRTPGDAVQSFDTDMFRLFGQLPPGDPDFDLLRITAGTDFGMPSPGHTTLRLLASGEWAVDSFFDLTYRIDFIGAPGGALAGMSGSTNGKVRLRIRGKGGCLHVPVNCDDGNQCTRDDCDPATGQCRHDPMIGATCDDGNVCTQDDICVQSAAGGVVCQGTPVDCDDKDPCTFDRCDPQACVVPDNGTGTATLPPRDCGYVSEDRLQILDGLPPGSSIDIAALHKNFICPAAVGVCSFPLPAPGSDCEQAGGSLGGEEQCANSLLSMNLVGTGALAGFTRTLAMPVGYESHTAPRTPGDPVQSFDALVFRMQGQISGDPDFDLLRITAGTDFGLPSPGHTILTRQPGGTWAVDSFFDITYRIDFIGRPGGPLQGMSGSTTGTVRFRVSGSGGCVHIPVNCDDRDPCTIDKCNPTTGACEHQPVSCDDSDLCTFDRCDPATGGCVHAPVNCDDGDACTADACDPATGQCVHKPIPLIEPDPIHFRDRVTIFWSPTPDASHWNTYRGTIPRTMLGSRLPASVYDQVCYESDDSGANGATIAMDMADPPLGTAFYYLVSGESVCGESVIGTPSAPVPGGVIPNSSPCPTPP